MPDRQGRERLFREMDVNGNGGLSLAEIDKAVESGMLGRALNCPDFRRGRAVMRAYKAADVSKDEFIEWSEFFKLLKYLVFFNNLLHKFDEIDTDGDHRITKGEFAAGCATLGLELSAEEAAAEFAQCDSDGGGWILFNEFCGWCADRHIASDVGAEPKKAPVARPKGKPRPAGKKAHKKAAKPAPQLTMPDKKRREGLFREMDVNGNGGLSLAEIDKAVDSGVLGRALNCPTFRRGQAVMRAYKAADVSKDEFIERAEFFRLLKYLVYFNNLLHKFDEIDTDGDHRLTKEEFAAGCATLGLPKEAAAEFAQCDSDGGGFVLFIEFCA